MSNLYCVDENNNKHHRINNCNTNAANNNGMMIVIDDDEEKDEQQQEIINTATTTDNIRNSNKIEKRKKMLEKRKSKIAQLKKRWKEQNMMRTTSTETTTNNNNNNNNNITKEDLKNIMSSLLEGKVFQMMQTMQDEISSLKEQQASLLCKFSSNETTPLPSSTAAASNHNEATFTNNLSPPQPQPSTSSFPQTPASNIITATTTSTAPPTTHQSQQIPKQSPLLFSQPKHHGSVDKDCWVIWNNAIYDKLRLLRRMKTIKFHEWEEFLERDVLIWRRHFELKEQFKTSDKKQHYTQSVDYISPVQHAKEFLGKTLQKIREGSFKNKEVSQDMLNKILDSVSNEGNIGPHQQDMLKTKEITPKSKINSPFWWLNLDIYRQLSLLVEMKLVLKTDWNGYMNKVMQLNDSILVETDRAQKIITFGEDVMKTIKNKTPTDKWFQFLQKKRTVVI